MSSKFYALLAALIPTKSVVAIIAFADTFVAKLHAAEAAQIEKAAAIAINVAELQKEQAEALNDAQRLGRVAANLGKLTA